MNWLVFLATGFVGVTSEILVPFVEQSTKPVYDVGRQAVMPI